jgi:hypothetical protein
VNRNDTIDILALVSAADRRTVGDTDVDVWFGVIGELGRDECAQAVRDHLRQDPDVWLQPGHVYKRARAIRHDMLEREPEERRSARQTAQEAKAAEDVRQIAAGLSTVRMGRKPQHPTPEYEAAKAVLDNWPWVNGYEGARSDTYTASQPTAILEAIRVYSVEKDRACKADAPYRSHRKPARRRLR